MEEAAAAVIREPVSPCGGDLASTTVQSDSGPSIELEGPSEPVKIPPTLSVNEDAPSSEAQETFPDGLLPLMVAVAAGVISPYDEEQGAPSSPETAAAAAAAAEGAPRLLECIFSPHPAQALAAADPKDLMYLHQHEAHNLLLRHAVRAEHDDKETFQLLQLLVLQPMQLQQDSQSEEQQHNRSPATAPRAAVQQQLLDQLLLPHQQREQQIPVECLCGLPIEGGVFSCSSSNDTSSTSSATSSESRRTNATPGATCRMATEAMDMHAASHALFSCCCQGKLRCFLLLERCCSIAAADMLLLQQGRGSLMHAAAMGGSRAIIQRLAATHGLSPRGALDCANYNEPIHLAACCGRTSAVLQLLELGVPLDAPDRFRRTAAFHAASNGHAMLLRALAAMGADLTVLDADGISLLQEATARRRIRDGRDREEIVQFLVQQNTPSADDDAAAAAARAMGKAAEWLAALLPASHSSRTAATPTIDKHCLH
ncbi:serine/threonine-protein phosphatase 6 regulatory ankyrin repeat subunit A [Cyclospora cayetanensis]|uniref:Serine/threonine-protein phosphatase 6 regulatory ankyrin repeat subunit A n=1 Tax=Cyclospora cayetanensis TaxID=88456 RepID=A0A6P6RXP6_9EIME|nr:serine/threonine-protein phosphatase 6 regulatory ankyrin repeat subunit A [Cyclospora cayetanensis]